MSNDPVRQALLDLPLAPVPEAVSARLRVMASHERQRRVSRFAWLDRWFARLQDSLRPLAVPAAGGLLSSVVLFGAMVSTLNIQRYLRNDVPLGIFTQVTVDELSPFGGAGEKDVLVEVTVDSHGRVSDFSIPNGKMGEQQLLQIGNLILFSTFTPATAYGQPVSGKILVALHHINVRG